MKIDKVLILSYASAIRPLADSEGGGFAIEYPDLPGCISDGEETCDGDPAAAIEELRTAGVQVRVNIVGFAISDRALKDTFRHWARRWCGGDAAAVTLHRSEESQRFVSIAYSPNGSV